MAEIIGRADVGDGIIWSLSLSQRPRVGRGQFTRGGDEVRQVECTVNGIGERAGNASMEEIVMGLRTKRSHFGVQTRVDTTGLCGLSHLVSSLTGFPVPPNKAIMGVFNAFAHEAGIHQHGVLCNRAYEIMKPEDVGAGTKLVLGKHSGKHAFRKRVADLGFDLTDEQVTQAFQLFKQLCDRKVMVTDGDLEAMIVDEFLTNTNCRRFSLEGFSVQATHGAGRRPLLYRRTGLHGATPPRATVPSIPPTPP